AITALSIVTSKNRGFYTTHTLTFSESYFIEETAFNNTRTKWIGVHKICQSRRHIYIYISSSSAHVIPKRIFDDEVSQDSFYRLLLQKWEAGINVEHRPASTLA